MSEDTANRKKRSPLMPRRHQEDLFICDIFDTMTTKADTASMEHPLFSMSTKPDTTPKNYSRGDIKLVLTPSAIGLATVHDRDILIYCISHLMRALNSNQEISKTLRFRAHDLLQTTNRPTNKRGYELLKNALKRLQGTQIETNITTGGTKQWDVFSFIDNAKTIRTGEDGRMEAIEITLSDWVFNAINAKGKEVLTYHPDYFRIRKPLERRMYEIARKCCGTRNDKWVLKLDTLRKQTGSNSSKPEFKRMVKAIVAANKEHNHIPDYTFELTPEDKIVIRPKRQMKELYASRDAFRIAPPTLKAHTIETAKKHAAGYDIYHIEAEWRQMAADKNQEISNPDGAFINYVKWFVANQAEHGVAAE